MPREAISSNVAITICFVVRLEHVGRNVGIFLQPSKVVPSYNLRWRAVSVPSFSLAGRAVPSASKPSVCRPKPPPSVPSTLNASTFSVNRLVTTSSAHLVRVQHFQGLLPGTLVFAPLSWLAPRHARLVTSMSLR